MDAIRKAKKAMTREQALAYNLGLETAKRRAKWFVGEDGAGFVDLLVKQKALYKNVDLEELVAMTLGDDGHYAGSEKMVADILSREGVIGGIDIALDAIYNTNQLAKEDFKEVPKESTEKPVEESAD